MQFNKTLPIFLSLITAGSTAPVQIESDHLDIGNFEGLLQKCESFHRNDEESDTTSSDPGKDYKDAFDEYREAIKSGDGE